MATKSLLVELFVEELPPKALKKLGEAFSKGIYEVLQRQELIDIGGAMNAGIYAP